MKNIKNQIIKKYLGVAYKHKGNDLTGLDCWTLPVNIYKDIGYDISFMQPEYQDNYKWPDIHNFMSKWANKWLEVEHPSLLDIILFDGKKQHCGVCLDRYRFIHATKSGVIISKINAKLPGHSLMGYYRLMELLYDYGKI